MTPTQLCSACILLRMIYTSRMQTRWNCLPRIPFYSQKRFLITGGWKVIRKSIICERMKKECSLYSYCAMPRHTTRYSSVLLNEVLYLSEPRWSRVQILQNRGRTNEKRNCIWGEQNIVWVWLNKKDVFTKCFNKKMLFIFTHHSNGLGYSI